MKNNDDRNDEMTFAQIVLAIIMGVSIGLFAPSAVVWAFFLGTRGDR